jgi:hypothetical protein
LALSATERNAALLLRAAAVDVTMRIAVACAIALLPLFVMLVMFLVR